MVVIEPNPDAEDRRRRRTNLRAPGAPPEAAAAPPPRGVAGAGDDGGDSDSDESPESARNNMRIKEVLFSPFIFTPLKFLFFPQFALFSFRDLLCVFDASYLCHILNFFADFFFFFWYTFCSFCM